MPFPQYSDQNQQAPEPRNLVNRTISYQQKSFSHSKQILLITNPIVWHRSTPFYLPLIHIFA
jgi:hypothetical protein